MSFVRALAVDMGTAADNAERLRDATVTTADAQERITASAEKASRLPPPGGGGGGIVDPSGRPVSTGSSGGGGSSRGGGEPANDGGHYEPSYGSDGSVRWLWVGPRSEQAEILRTRGVLTTSDPANTGYGRTKSGHGTGGSGGSGASGAEAYRARFFSGEPGQGPGLGEIYNPTPTGAGKQVTAGEAVIAGELRGLRNDIRNLGRSDNGAGLRQQGLV